MSRLTTLLLLLSFSTITKAQFLQPIFEEAVLLKDINSEAEESIPIISNAGTNIYFHRTYFEESGDDYDVLGRDIWMSELSKVGNDTSAIYSKTWKRPYRLFREGEVEGINDIIGASADGNTLYLLNTVFTRDSYTRRVVSLKRKNKSEWEDKYEEIKVPGLVFDDRRIELRMNENEDVLLISMSSSPRALYEDLYVSLKQSNGKWSKLINLGDNINTSRAEISPFLAKDNKTLYFSSDGHDGLGDADIFMSKRLDDSWEKWTRPLNLGESINSEGFDGYFTMQNGRDIYFASDRNSEFYELYATVFNGKYTSANSEQISGEFKYQNLPVAETKLEVYDVDGNLIDIIETDEDGKFVYTKLKSDEDYFVQLQTEDPTNYEGAKVYLVNEDGKTKRYILTDNKRFVHDKSITNKKQVFGYYLLKGNGQSGKAIIIKDENNFIIDTLYTDEEGGFKYEQLAYDNNISILPTELNEGDFSDVDLYFVDENGNKIKAFKLGPNGDFILDESYSLEGERLIFFEFNSSKLSKEGKDKLNSLLAKAKGSTSIVLIGHADDIGGEKVNYEVGMDRAEAVKNYLHQKGISKERIKTESKGKSAPIAPNDEENRAKNRRVEVIFK